MAGIKDILDIERERSEPTDWLNIHLFQEGSFYRAYEVSAWLCHTHISQFKVTHRHVKGIDQPIAFVGFPVTSLEKRLPEGAAVASVADKHIVLMFERTFIQDSYSCIKNRGTHYGIKRLEMHIRQESRNYSVPCFVLKLDVRGYFMHIDRKKFLEIALDSLDRMSRRQVSKHARTKWREIVDMEFIRYLTETLVMLNPLTDCKIVGNRSDWDDLPADKSLFHSPQGCGLPIGNLTSQLFSNVYMNVFDQFMKRNLKCCHYGRYVDDSYIVSADISKQILTSMLGKDVVSQSEKYIMLLEHNVRAA